MWLGTDMQILKDCTSRYTFTERLITKHFDHYAEIKHHQWYRQVFGDQYFP